MCLYYLKYILIIIAQKDRPVIRIRTMFILIIFGISKCNNGVNWDTKNCTGTS